MGVEGKHVYEARLEGTAGSMGDLGDNEVGRCSAEVLSTRDVYE